MFVKSERLLDRLVSIAFSVEKCGKLCLCLCGKARRWWFSRWIEIMRRWEGFVGRAFVIQSMNEHVDDLTALLNSVSLLITSQPNTTTASEVMMVRTGTCEWVRCTDSDCVFS